jgi:hypothetical protein
MAARERQARKSSPDTYVRSAIRIGGYPTRRIASG